MHSSSKERPRKLGLFSMVKRRLRSLKSDLDMVLGNQFCVALLDQGQGGLQMSVPISTML